MSASRERRAWRLALLAWLAVACAGEPDSAASGYPIAEVTIGIHRVQVEVADTPERMARGLSGRSELAEGRGMIFPYPHPARQGFWMLDMHFDIDIVWIRADRIIDLTLGAPHDPPGELPVYRPREPADLVLEVPAGTSQRMGWRIGDRVLVEPPVRPQSPSR